MDLERKRRLSIAAYIVYMAVYYAAMYLPIEPLEPYLSTFSLIGDVLALSLYWFGVRCQPEEKRKPWIWFGVSAALYSIGESTWAYYSEFLHIDPTTPSLCDVFYVSNSYASLYAFISYLRQSKVELREIFSDMVISLLAAGGILYYFIMLPLFQDESLAGLPLAIEVSTIVIDLFLLVGVLLIIFGSDVRRLFSRQLLLFVASCLGFLLIDQLSMAFAIYEVEMPDFLGPLWPFPFWLLGLASMYPDDSETAEVQTTVHPKLAAALDYFRFLIPYILTLAILILVGVQLHIVHSLFLWAILLVTFLSLRQIAVLLRNRRLMQTVQENEKRLNQQNYELLRLNKQILRDAEMDFLTQLANRRYIDQAFLRFTPPEGVTGTLGLLLIDVDFFKRINDTYGHQEGDLVLKQVASCISAIIRGGDIAGRYGGDEFIVLLPTADVHAIAAVAKRLQDKIHADDMLTARNVTLSIGCASQTSTQTTYDSKQLLKQADDALYHAKENGRNQFVVYHEK